MSMVQENKAKHFKSALAEFPIKKDSYKFKAKAKANGLVRSSVLANVTNKVVEKLDREFKNAYKTSFSKQFTKHIQTKENISSTSATVARQVVNDVERQWNETAVERYIGYISS